MQAVILAAGKGLRLKPLTDHTPKGLVPILGKPLLEWTLERLPKKIESVHFVVGYLREQIQNYFGNNFHGTPLTYSTQDPLSGTGSALMCAKDFVQGKFLVVNGDDIYESLDLESLCTASSWSMLCTKTNQPLGGAVATDQGSYITNLVEDRTDAEKLLNCGAYGLDESFFSLPLVSIETHAGAEYSLPHTIVQKGNKTPVQAILASRWLPIGTPDELAKAEQIMHNVPEAIS